MNDIICKNFGLSFIGGDKKRLKMIKSFEDDIKAHFKVTRGKIFEIERPDSYSNSVGDFLTKIDLNEKKSIYFFKNRFKITRPPSKGTRDGYRIVFGILKQEDNSFLYIPTLVFIAKEEKETLAVNGKKFRLHSKNLRLIIQERFSSISI